MTTESQALPGATEEDDEYFIPPPEPISEQEAQRAYRARMIDPDAFTPVKGPDTDIELPAQYQRPRRAGRA